MVRTFGWEIGEMISRYDVINAFEDEMKKGNTEYSYDRETDMIKGKDGKDICSLDEFMPVIRRKNHCNFESIYYCHATLDNVYRCLECGTVIFGGDDERYDPACRCPTCSNDNSVCRNTWWSADEIKNEPEKQQFIEGLIEQQRIMNEIEERRRKRGGKSDSEIWIKEYRGKKHYLEFKLECNNLFLTKLKGLKFVIRHSEKDYENDFGYFWKRDYVIPLSISAAIWQWYKLPKMRKHWKAEREAEK